MSKKITQIKTHLKHFVVQLLKPIIKKCGFDLIPGYEKKLFTKFRFLDNKFFSPITEPKIKDRINKLTIDSTFSKTELCNLGKDFPTDKSPYSEKKHRHPFTAVYDLLFSNINPPLRALEASQITGLFLCAIHSFVIGPIFE